MLLRGGQLLHLGRGLLAAQLAEEGRLAGLVAVVVAAPVMALLGLGLAARAAALGHLDGLRVPPATAGLDGGRLECGGSQGDSFAARDEELEDLRVHEALHGLAVDVGDEVAGAQSGVEGGRALVDLCKKS